MLGQPHRLRIRPENDPGYHDPQQWVGDFRLKALRPAAFTLRLTSPRSPLRSVQNNRYRGSDRGNPKTSKTRRVAISRFSIAPLATSPRQQRPNGTKREERVYCNTHPATHSPCLRILVHSAAATAVGIAGGVVVVGVPFPRPALKEKRSLAIPPNANQSRPAATAAVV